MELKLVKGRPEDTSNRLDKEIRVYDLLDELGIEYSRIDHMDTPAMNMEICKLLDETLDATICKNLFLCNRQKTNFYLLMIPADKVFHTKEISSQINSARLSFGEPEYMEKYLDILPGAVSVLGLMNDKENNVRLLVDEDVLKGEYFGCHPCVNTCSLRLKTKDILEKFVPAVHHDVTIVRLGFSEDNSNS